MVQIWFRAFVTVFTVAVAVAASAVWGESAGGKLLAAAVIATVIALVEWLMVWTPKHYERARLLLDPRSIMIGVWVQDVLRVDAPQEVFDASNRFAVYTVEYAPPDGYTVSGRAYDEHGKEHARYWSEGSVSFTKDGREMSYVFNGEVTGAEVSAEDVSQSGLARLSLETDDSGKGHVEHVAKNVRLVFDFYRVTPGWLEDRGFKGFEPETLRDVGIRNKFALECAKWLSESDA